MSSVYADPSATIPLSYHLNHFTLRLDVSPPGPLVSPEKATLVNYEVLNQSVGNCYANAAAIVLDTYLRSRDAAWKTWQTSPMSLALNYARNEPEALKITYDSAK
jgi:hypothetical protein